MLDALWKCTYIRLQKYKLKLQDKDFLRTLNKNLRILNAQFCDTSMESINNKGP